LGKRALHCIGIALITALLLVALALSLGRDLGGLGGAFAEGTVSLQIQLFYWFGYLHFELTRVYHQVFLRTGFCGHGLYGFIADYSVSVYDYPRLG
jgi:hypothetical protein